MRPALLFLLFIIDAFGQINPPITKQFNCIPGNCCDQHEWCRFWASIGECDANSVWMLSNCQLACDSCFSVPPSGPGFGKNDINNCKLVRMNPSRIAESLKELDLVIPVEDVSIRTLLSADDINDAADNGCAPQLSSSDCTKSLCYHLSYRTMDGTCNNMNNSVWGAAFRSFIRKLPPIYDDGIGEPVSSLFVKRPTARELSRGLLASPQTVHHDKYNSMLMQWGQFISHDMAKTALQAAKPCRSCDPVRSRCMTIFISPNDRNNVFKRRRCLKITRSSPVCGTGLSATMRREQLNENTAFLDASTIYGSSLKDLQKFRHGRTGFLKTQRFNNQTVLPFNKDQCQSPSNCKVKFIAGDARINIFLGLSAVHIILTREHNRVARFLKSNNPHWTGDRLFHETRKIIGAEVQAIAYKEFLPKILGNAMSGVVGPYTGYDPDIDSSISNVFATAAYRFGHGMLEEFYNRFDESGRIASHGGFTFRSGISESQRILFEGGIDPILWGFLRTPVKRPHRMTPSVTESLFDSTDLGSVNIQRGRDHGLPSYNRWREFCHLDRAENFDDLRFEILDDNVREVLKNSYESPDEVDVYIGAMLEDPVIGGLVGPTLACLLGDQFKRLRDGDRFYYENPGIFTASQLKELKKTSLSRIICDNGDDIGSITKDAFVLQNGGTSPCSSLTSIDLSAWIERYSNAATPDLTAH